jgi:hypothetical protein
MQFIFKPNNSKTFRARYTLSDSPRVYDVSLRTRNKEDAEARLKVLVHEHEQLGEISPRLIRETARRPVAELFAEYVADLGRKGCAADYIKMVRNRLPLLFGACKWRAMSDIKAADFLAWRRKQDFAPKTLNHYLDTARAFINWLVKQELVEKNPLLHLDKVDNRKAEQAPRRAFTPDELSRLLQGAGATKSRISFCCAPGCASWKPRPLNGAMWIWMGRCRAFVCGRIPRSPVGLTSSPFRKCWWINCWPTSPMTCA